MIFLVDQDTLVSKYIYNTSGTTNERLYILEKDSNTGEYICMREDKKIIRLSYDIIFKDFTSISPVYVASIKKSKDKVGLVINPYLSEWEDPENAFKYIHGMEIDLEEAINHTDSYEPNWMVYNRIEKNKSPKYKDAKTMKVVYGYYTTSINHILFLLEKHVDMPEASYIHRIKKFIRAFITKSFGMQYCYESTYKALTDWINGKKSSDNLYINNIFNIPLNFNLIDRSSVKLLQYDFSLDLEKFKNYYTPYNIVILKTLDEGNVYIMGFHNKSVLSGDVEYTSSLSKDEIAKLLDFNKG